MEAWRSTLDDLGVRIRAPAVPHPEPDPHVLARLCRMYDVTADETEANENRRSAARRTAVAIERRRLGWTRAGAEAEYRERVIAGLEARLAVAR